MIEVFDVISLLGIYFSNVWFYNDVFFSQENNACRNIHLIFDAYFLLRRRGWGGE